MNSPPHTEGLCDWCFEPLGQGAAEFNNGVGHNACAQYAYDSVMGPDALPWRPERRWHRADPMLDFLQRLGCEAAKLGIDPHAFARAVERAAR
jgi:hypothetical protein